MFQGLFKSGKFVAMTTAVIPLLDDLDRTDPLAASCQVSRDDVHLCSSTPLRCKSNLPGTGSLRQQPDIGIVAVIQLANKTVVAHAGGATKCGARGRMKGPG